MYLIFFVHLHTQQQDHIGLSVGQVYMKVGKQVTQVQKQKNNSSKPLPQYVVNFGRFWYEMLLNVLSGFVLLLFWLSVQCINRVNELHYFGEVEQLTVKIGNPA